MIIMHFCKSRGLFSGVISNWLKMLVWTLVCFPLLLAAVVVLKVTSKDMKVFICFRFIGS